MKRYGPNEIVKGDSSTVFTVLKEILTYHQVTYVYGESR